MRRIQRLCVPRQFIQDCWRQKMKQTMSVFLEYSKDRRQNYGLRNPKRGNQSCVPQKNYTRIFKILSETKMWTESCRLNAWGGGRSLSSLSMSGRGPGGPGMLRTAPASLHTGACAGLATAVWADLVSAPGYSQGPDIAPAWARVHEHVA